MFGWEPPESDDEVLADDDSDVVDATSTEVELAPAPTFEAWVVVEDEFENEAKDPLPPLPPLVAFETLVADDESADVVEATTDSEADVVELKPSAPLPPFPF